MNAVNRIRRTGKEAYKFQFTSTFEYITLECNGTWRPSVLRVVWLRNHRRVQSVPVQWDLTEDRGPNGAKGKAKFKPAFSVGLVVTLYKGKHDNMFEGKEYKYYIQDESQRGVKVLASFTLDLKDYTTVGNDGSRDVFEMTFHPESRKIHDAVLGMTLTSKLVRQGSAMDCDMQSTFSAVTSDHGSMQLDSDESEGDGGGGGGGGGGERDGGIEDTTLVPPAVEVTPLTIDPEINTMAFSGPKASQNGIAAHDGAHNSKGLATARTHATPADPTTTQLTTLTANAGSAQFKSSKASPSPSPSPSASPSHSTFIPPHIPPKNSPLFNTASSVQKAKKTVKSFFMSPRVNIKSKSKQQEKGEDSRSHSPLPLSPPHTLTDSSHRPWVEITEMVKKLKESVERLENENRQLHASMEVQGWLYKRGVKGLTANVWRRRFFRIEGSKIFYYKTICASHPQGFIDLDAILGLREVCPDEQDKNCSTFIVRCEGRTYQLQAIDQPTMKKWMSTIEFLTNWRKSYEAKGEKEGESEEQTAL